ncbi:hypothetical protein FH972_018117 [Carpinus fangiana]|uniref:Uncharacterized protein n=1 Tax=Carpinus fangiana TaxID=176857 RepID=A0A5N6RL01_9ROSI|nr:hypothetical protein FH972_018117 [Carpinus fangiana]
MESWFGKLGFSMLFEMGLWLSYRVCSGFHCKPWKILILSRSPRRILNLSKKRRAIVSSLDADERASGFGVSGEHGPKPSKDYGFVGSITTVVAASSLHRSCFYFMFRLG